MAGVFISRGMTVSLSGLRISLGPDGSPGVVIVDLAAPVFFEIDPSKTPICRIMFHARIIELHRFGMWQLAKMEGLANEHDGTIMSRGFTTTPFSIDDVLENWQKIDTPEELQSRPTMRLVTTGGWDVDESITPPLVARVRFVTQHEFDQSDTFCP